MHERKQDNGALEKTFDGIREGHAGLFALLVVFQRSTSFSRFSPMAPKLVM